MPRSSITQYERVADIGSLMMKSLKPQGIPGIEHLVIGIGEQIILQLLAHFPASQFFQAIGTDAKDDGIARFDLREVIAEGAGLVVAAHGIGFGEGEYDDALATIVAEPHCLPVLIQQFKVRRRLSNSQHNDLSLETMRAFTNV